LSPSLPACSSVWDAVCGSLVLSLPCLRSCLRPCLPVCQLVLQPGMLCPAPWTCLCLVSGLVSQLVSQSASLFFSLGCCVRLPCFVFVLSPVLFPNLPACSSAWDAVSGSVVLPFSCLQCCLRSGLVCCVSPPPWSCVSLVSGLVSHFVFHLVWDAVPVVSRILCAICATVWGLRWCNFVLAKACRICVQPRRSC